MFNFRLALVILAFLNTCLPYSAKKRNLVKYGERVEHSIKEISFFPSTDISEKSIAI
jgi:hypothetical protein